VLNDPDLSAMPLRGDRPERIHVRSFCCRLKNRLCSDGRQSGSSSGTKKFTVFSPIIDGAKKAGRLSTPEPGVAIAQNLMK
jgi:hypothetical protein